MMQTSQDTKILFHTIIIPLRVLASAQPSIIQSESDAKSPQSSATISTFSSSFAMPFT